MANTLTGLYQTWYANIDKVSRELTGFIGAVNRDSGAQRAAIGETVTVPITRAATTATTTAATTVPDTGDSTVDNATIAITRTEHVMVRWNGEETKALQNAGTYQDINFKRILQGIRALVNYVEADVASLYAKASRAYGTAGTAPFGTANDFSDFAQVRRILEDNGAGSGDLQLVMSSAAMANLRGKQSGLFHVDSAGTDELLREGIVARVEGFGLHQSAQIQSHTKGTGTGYDANGGEPSGETSIALDGGDSGTILAGDVVTFAGDTNKYVVASGGTATGAASGNITLAKPGLRAALASTTEMTIGNSYAANMAFDRDAIVLATRQPALPDGGDLGMDRIELADPVSGLVFEASMYPGFRQNSMFIGLAWGYQLIKPEHVALLLG